MIRQVGLFLLVLLVNGMLLTLEQCFVLLIPVWIRWLCTGSLKEKVSLERSRGRSISAPELCAQVGYVKDSHLLEDAYLLAEEVNSKADAMDVLQHLVDSPEMVVSKDVGSLPNTPELQCIPHSPILIASVPAVAFDDVDSLPNSPALDGLRKSSTMDEYVVNKLVIDSKHIIASARRQSISNKATLSQNNTKCTRKPRPVSCPPSLRKSNLKKVTFNLSMDTILYQPNYNHSDHPHLFYSDAEIEFMTQHAFNRAY